MCYNSVCFFPNHNYYTRIHTIYRDTVFSNTPKDNVLRSSEINYHNVDPNYNFIILSIESSCIRRSQFNNVNKKKLIYCIVVGLFSLA